MIRVGLYFVAAPVLLGVVAIAAARVWVTEAAERQRRAEVEAAACSAHLRAVMPLDELRRACLQASLIAAAEYQALRRDCEVRR